MTNQQSHANDSEPERTIVEASVLLMTLLFAIASIAPDKVAIASYLAPAAGLLVIAVAAAIIVMFRKVENFELGPRQLRVTRLVEFVFLLLALGYLLITFINLAQVSLQNVSAMEFLFVAAILATASVFILNYVQSWRAQRKPSAGRKDSD
jgi:hypothetical protein